MSAAGTVSLLTAGLLAGAITASSPAGAAPGPIASRASTDVTSDALPTAQINGVVRAQQIVGNTVFVAGSFTTARPAGSAAGVNTVARGNLMAYTLSTGVMTSWAPTTNGQVQSMALSPDNSRLYIAGEFTTVNGVSAPRIAAIDTTTGALVTSFKARTDAIVKAVTVTPSAVYVGGSFSTANGISRLRLAAFNPSTGAVLDWNPGASASVWSMTTNPDNSLIIVGGAFDQIASHAATGLGAVNPVSGAWVDWQATNVVSAYGQANAGAGTGAAIYSLSHDDKNVYGTAYNYYGYGNLEGSFSADGNSGNVNWVEDCHGDTYGVYASASAVYTVSHDHYCGNIGGFPQTSPDWTFHHSLAFSKNATGTINHDPLGYHDWYGTASPSLLNWFPDWTTGKYTGANQAAYSITGSANYVVAGGEFTAVNGTSQQGLVRFGTPAVAPNKQGPRVGQSQWVPSVKALSNTSARISIQTNWDRDDQDLTYQFARSGAGTLSQTVATSQFWNRPSISFIDQGLTPGATYTYFVKVTDPSGNATYSQNVPITIPTDLQLSNYAKDVYADGASNYWRLDDAAGSPTVSDWAGPDNLTVNGGGVGFGQSGAIVGDQDTAASFDGNNSFAATQTAQPGPDNFTTEAWFRTTSTSGGKIIGFGDKNTGLSGNYDRHIYMNPDGRVSFGVYNGSSYIVTSPKALNDGTWHQAVATLSPEGLMLYIDGKRVGVNAGTTVGQTYSGYWRVGGDSSWSGNAYFNGNIDDVAVYRSPLTLEQVRKHYTDSGRSLGGAPAPTDGYGQAVYTDEPSAYYRLDEASGTTALDSSGNGADGVYSGGLTQGATSPVAGAGHTAVTFGGVDGTVGSAGPVSNPTTYSEEAWFRTNSTVGGKIIGFGRSQTGNSGNYDRHVYMLPSGQLVFGTYTGQMNLATSPSTYNDNSWHYVVATQGSGGMKLYVDGLVVATNGQTGQENYDGYWRVGGDSSWAGNNYFAGTIDEAAFYSTVLSPARVAAHYAASSAVNKVPTAAFTVSKSNLDVAVDASASADSDGTIASYRWDFGDGTVVTNSSPTATHSYTAGDTYTITLTVTDNGGASAVTSNPVTVAPAPVNQAPVPAFTSTVDRLTVSFDAGGSTDSDGTVKSYAWNFGDGATTAGSTATTSHTYSAAGPYSVTLTVTDDDDATAQLTKTVTAVAANVAPTARFVVASQNGLTASFDGSTSSDSDGSVASYAWDFGDGGSSTSQNPSYVYAGSGTYTVKLTVKDNDGASDSTSKTVIVTAPASPTVAVDAFARTVSSGWGSADTGGAWTRLSGATTDVSVGSGAGTIRTSAPGKTTALALNSVSAKDVTGTVDLSYSAVPAGGGVLSYAILRRTSGGEYKVRVKVLGNGLTIQVTRLVTGSAEAVIGTATLAGTSYVAGDVLRLKFRTATAGASSTISGKVWKTTQAEPTAWQVNAADTTAALQAPGAIGFGSYLSAAAGTNSTLNTTVDNVAVQTP